MCAARTLAYHLPPRPAAQVAVQGQICGGLFVVANMNTVDGQGHRKLPGNAAQRNKFKENNAMVVLEAMYPSHDAGSTTSRGSGWRRP